MKRFLPSGVEGGALNSITQSQCVIAAMQSTQAPQIIGNVIVGMGHDMGAQSSHCAGIVLHPDCGMYSGPDISCLQSLEKEISSLISHIIASYMHHSYCVSNLRFHSNKACICPRCQMLPRHLCSQLG
jgi:hypothetical protein